MLKKLIMLSLTFASVFSAEKDETVVCIHGFMGGQWSMRYIEKKLTRDGWDVVNWEYPSRQAFIRDHASHLVEELQSVVKQKPGKPVNFVVHSMGSLVLLSALNMPNCPEEAKQGEIVLITPPLQGASYGRWLNQFSLARSVAKDFSGAELLTKENFKDLGEYPQTIQRILVIAGSLGFNPVIRGQNDGTVAVDETQMSRPHERVVIRRGHKTIVFSPRVYKIISSFFKGEEREPLHRNCM